MKECIYLFLGGGLGTLARYGLQELVKGVSAPSGTMFPYGTWLANLAGCFLIGLFYSLSERLHWPADLRLMLTAGLCGGFTTFSTFSMESLSLIRSEAYGTFGLYLLSSLLVGLLAVWFGGWCGKQM